MREVTELLILCWDESYLKIYAKFSTP